MGESEREKKRGGERGKVRGVEKEGGEESERKRGKRQRGRKVDEEGEW